MDFSADSDGMAPTKQSYMREAAEKNVLAYITALIYEQNTRQWIQERGLVFTPMVAEVFEKLDPAAKSCSVMIDFDNTDVSPLNANCLAQLSGEYIIKSPLKETINDRAFWHYYSRIIMDN